MKTLRKFCVSLILAAALVLPIFAGDVQFPGAKSVSQPINECPSGDVQFPGAVSDCEPPTEDEDAVFDPATETILTLLEGLLTLF